MILLLTIKSSLKELSLLAIYLIMGMFIFSAGLYLAELSNDADKGVTDCLHGEFDFSNHVSVL